ncbi:translation initiation factor eIF-1A [Candidatus Woesearchaeota archaeon]|nr:translation initiation factor eIF-1A [Candidatus Woesearchaeota archaeon]
MPEEESEEFIRVRLPRGGEFLGVVEQRLGGSRSKVKCFDGKARVCRIPGRLKRKLWIRENDIVLVEPWELDNEKGDIIFKYKPVHLPILKKKGLMKDVSTDNF